MKRNQADSNIILIYCDDTLNKSTIKTVIMHFSAV